MNFAEDRRGLQDFLIEKGRFIEEEGNIYFEFDNLKKPIIEILYEDFLVYEQKDKTESKKIQAKVQLESCYSYVQLIGYSDNSIQNKFEEYVFPPDFTIEIHSYQLDNKQYHKKSCKIDEFTTILMEENKLNNQVLRMKQKYSNLIEIAGLIARMQFKLDIKELKKQEQQKVGRVVKSQVVEEVATTPYGGSVFQGGWQTTFSADDKIMYKEIISIKPLLLGAVYYNNSLDKYLFKVFRSGSILRTVEIDLPNAKLLQQYGHENEVGKRLLHKYREHLIIGAWVQYGNEHKEKLENENKIRLKLRKEQFNKQKQATLQDRKWSARQSTGRTIDSKQKTSNFKND